MYQRTESVQTSFKKPNIVRAIDAQKRYEQAYGNHKRINDTHWDPNAKTTAEILNRQSFFTPRTADYFKSDKYNYQSNMQIKTATLGNTISLRGGEYDFAYHRGDAFDQMTQNYAQTEGSVSEYLSYALLGSLGLLLMV